MTFSLLRSIGPTILIGGMLAAGAAHGRTFISPMGEPFRGTPDGKEPAETWFVGADKNGDGRITRAEFMADAGRFFVTLDVNHDNEIGPEEIDRYEQEVAPEVQTDGFGELPGGNPKSRAAGGGRGHGGGHGGGGGGHRGGGDGAEGEQYGDDHPGPTEPTAQGAARFGYLALPEPIVAADTDFNRGVSPKEFAAAASERFDLLDTNHDGLITRDDLAGLGRSGGVGHRPGGKRPPPDAPTSGSGN